MSQPVTNRYEFVLYFDVTNGNPNGDPDAGNMPRVDPETGHGLVSDVALKRKVRNYVALAGEGRPGHEIYMAEGTTLNLQHKRAWQALSPEITKDEDFKQLPKDQQKSRALTRWMCANFWDIRTFGAVMTTGVNAGQVRGPVQFGFARSVEPIVPQEITITRVASTTQKHADEKGWRTMGRKHIVPYGLYRAHGFVSAPLASHPVKGTGFCEDDLELLWQALSNMFDHDHSAARGEMTTRKLIVFRHESQLGNAQAQALFDRVQTWRTSDGSIQAIQKIAIDTLPPARGWSDYVVSIDTAALPAGITVIER